MSHLHELDGFQLLSAFLAVTGGPIMLAAGAPAGWSFLLIAAGITLLLAQWAIVSDVTFEPLRATDVVLSIAGMVCVGIAIVYLTRAADDLPTLFPGYDVDSESFRLVPGFVTLTVGAAALGRAIASTRPRRAAR
jgi:hypothetical protein